MPRQKKHSPDSLALAIGQRLRQLRLERGMTAESVVFLGALSSKGFMSDIEHGLARPSLATLQEIANVLGVELIDLLTFPEHSDRQALIDRTRHLRSEVVRKLLAELTKPARKSATKRKPPKATHPARRAKSSRK